VLTGATLTFNPAAGYVGTPVVMTVNGASDPAPASPGNGPPSGVAGGEYWLGTTAPAPGGGTAFTGTSASIPTTSLAAGTYTVGVRVRDAAGNWSTSTQTATLTVQVPDVIFSNGFDTGGAPWGWSSRSSNSTTRLNATAGAALFGARGLQAQGNNTNYVQYNFGTVANPASTTYDARFYVNPNGNVSTGKDILAAATNTAFGTQLFHVRYRTSGTTPQVQIQVGATANATWANLAAGTNLIEVVWQSGTSLTLYLNGTSSQTIPTAAAGSVGSVRLGSVTSTGASTLMYFDAFASKRTVSALIGP
jgi:hypothetical protein